MSDDERDPKRVRKRHVVVWIDERDTESRLIHVFGPFTETDAEEWVGKLMPPLNVSVSVEPIERPMSPQDMNRVSR